MASKTQGHRMLVIVAVGTTLLALVTTALMASPIQLIRMPDGHWLLARVSDFSTRGGRRHRGYVVGADMIVRQELDTDGDGAYDVRGDDWSREAPRWCWIRSDSGWSFTTPMNCAEALRGLTPSPP